MDEKSGKNNVIVTNRKTVDEKSGKSNVPEFF
jgi:hypothetical protein